MSVVTASTPPLSQQTSISVQSNTMSDQAASKKLLKHWFSLIKEQENEHEIHGVKMVHQSDFKGRSLLHVAAFAGNDLICGWLVTIGANICAEDLMGRNPLHFAAYAGHASTVDFFLKSDSLWDIVYKGDSTGRSPCITAACEGHVDVIRCFIDNLQKDRTFLMDPVIDSHFGGNMLHWACLKGNLDVVKVLVESGINIHSKSYNSETALQIASISTKASSETYDYLDRWDKESSLFLCEFSNESANIIDKLSKMSHKQISRSKFYHDLDYKSALHIAAEIGSLDAVKWLCENGWDLNARDMFDRTPLHWSVLYTRIHVTEYLISKGCRTSLETTSGKTASQVAHQMGLVKLSQILSDSNSATREDGHTDDNNNNNSNNSISTINSAAVSWESVTTEFHQYESDRCIAQEVKLNYELVKQMEREKAISAATSTISTTVNTPNTVANNDDNNAHLNLSFIKDPSISDGGGTSTSTSTISVDEKLSNNNSNNIIKIKQKSVSHHNPAISISTEGGASSASRSASITKDESNSKINNNTTTIATTINETTPSNSSAGVVFELTEYNSQVTEWMYKLNFENNIATQSYIDIFITNGFISLLHLACLTESSLSAMEVKRGHRRKILKAVPTINEEKSIVFQRLIDSSNSNSNNNSSNSNSKSHNNDVDSWLDILHMGVLVDVLKGEGFDDIESVMLITHEDLQDLQVPGGFQALLLNLCEFYNKDTKSQSVLVEVNTAKAIDANYDIGSGNDSANIISSSANHNNNISLLAEDDG